MSRGLLFNSEKTMKIKNIFITGAIHIGKSTILNKVIERLPDFKIAGFRTLPIFEDKKKKGFRFETLQGRGKIFAHIDLKTETQFDVYQFDPEIFEQIGVASLKKAIEKSDLILMDEIGMMEQRAVKFRQAIIACLNSPKLVLGSFQQRASWFSAILKERKDTAVFPINKINRDSIPELIIELIKKN